MTNCNFILLLLRIVLGICFILHGAQKVFGWFGGSGLEGWNKYMSTFGLPSHFATLIAWTEFIAGFLLIFGVFTRLTSAVMLIFMAVAIYIAHWKKGYFAGNGGYEYQIMIMVNLLALMIVGGGKFSLFKSF